MNCTRLSLKVTAVTVDEKYVVLQLFIEFYVLKHYESEDFNTVHNLHLWSHYIYIMCIHIYTYIHMCICVYMCVYIHYLHQFDRLAPHNPVFPFVSELLSKTCRGSFRELFRDCFNELLRKL